MAWAIIDMTLAPYDSSAAPATRICVCPLVCCRLVWLYWLSPMSWAIRSLAQNEFNDESYGRDEDRIAGMRAGDYYLTQCVNVWKRALDVGVMSSFFVGAVVHTCLINKVYLFVALTHVDGDCTLSSSSGAALPLVFVLLGRYEISTERAYKWGGAAYLASFWIFSNVLSIIALCYRDRAAHGKGHAHTDQEQGIAPTLRPSLQEHLKAKQHRDDHATPTVRDAGSGYGVVVHRMGARR